jgi:transcriptional regulator with XRE-family HTH domain
MSKIDNFGKNLREARLNKEWNQIDLANFLGLSQGIISQYENGKRIITPFIARKITVALDISYDSLIGIDIMEDNRMRIKRKIETLTIENLNRLEDYVNLLIKSER